MPLLFAAKTSSAVPSVHADASLQSQSQPLHLCPAVSEHMSHFDSVHLWALGTVWESQTPPHPHLVFHPTVLCALSLNMSIQIIFCMFHSRSTIKDSIHSPACDDLETDVLTNTNDDNSDGSDGTAIAQSSEAGWGCSVNRGILVHHYYINWWGTYSCECRWTRST